MECHVCELNDAIATLPLRERVYVDEHWRVSHGWSASTCRRGARCARTYVMLFAEHPRYRHLHVHVVPRMDWFGEEERSARVFRFLTAPTAEHVPAEERDRLAASVGAAIVREL